MVCTWYDRLTRSREFYVLDKEFRTHRVDFITLHDPTDRNTASGRFMEMMLVGSKAYEREQTGKKVSIKMRMRAEKGMWNGGLVPFGFAPGDDHILRPDGEKSLLIPQLFQVYVQHASDFVVRDWLRAHQIPSPTGSPVWAVGSIRDLLGNRRYVAEIEINKGMKGVDELPEFDSYRIVKAPHEPLAAPELFELAQAIRKEKAKASPNRKGRPRSYSLNQCERVYPLQGRLYCAECGHSMSPYYVMHKPNEKEKRRNPSTIHYYICAHQMMHGLRTSGHSNRILAKVPEAWIVEQLKFLCESEGLIEEAVALAREKASGQLQPSREALGLNKFALQENQRQIDRLIESITSGSVSGALLGLLHGKASELQGEQDDLKREERQLLGALHPLEAHFDAGAVRGTLGRFCELAEAAQPEEMQRLVRTLVHRMEWQPSGDGHAVELYCLPGTSKNEAQIKRYPKIKTSPHLSIRTG